MLLLLLATFATFTRLTADQSTYELRRLFWLCDFASVFLTGNESCSLWLNVSAGGLNNDYQILKAGLQFLKHHREDNGRWKGFPYHYTLYVFNEIGPELALEEMQFAASSIGKWIKRNPQTEDKVVIRDTPLVNVFWQKFSQTGGLKFTNTQSLNDRIIQVRHFQAFKRFLT